MNAGHGTIGQRSGVVIQYGSSRGLSPDKARKRLD